MDSLTIFALCRELHDLFAGARVDKVHQPTDKDVVLTLRARSGTERLLLSANRNQPRAHCLFAKRPVNPEEPPMFCMLLRKRVEGGRVASVQRLGEERIVALTIDHYNELGDPVRTILLLEVMGKHSNLLLCEVGPTGQPTRILDSLVHVSPDVSRVRPVLPGFQYTPVPPQPKRGLASLTADQLTPLGLGDLETGAQVKALTRDIAGVSPLTVREALWRAQTLRRAEPALSLEASVVTALHLLADVVALRTEPSSAQLDQLGRPVAVAPFLLTHCDPYRVIESLNQGLDAMYQATVEIRQTSRLAATLTRTVQDSQDKLRGKRTKLTRQFQDSQGHDALRVKGELLTTYSQQVHKGLTEVTLANYYDDERPLVIALVPALSAIENAQRYFRQSSKRKRAIPILSREIEQTEIDLDYLDRVATHLVDATPENLLAIQEELTRQGFLRATSGSRPSQRSTKRRDAAKGTAALTPPDSYVSSDGMTIRVGRNNLQNDRLTLRSSQPHDLWLHVKDQAGSHVVVQTNGAATPSATLHEAALLATYFSKGRDSTNVPVDYAQIRHVWKPNGARPGHVLYEGQRTLIVTPDRELVQAILARKA